MTAEKQNPPPDSTGVLPDFAHEWFLERVRDAYGNLEGYLDYAMEDNNKMRERLVRIFYTDSRKFLVLADFPKYGLQIGYALKNLQVVVAYGLSNKVYELVKDEFEKFMLDMEEDITETPQYEKDGRVGSISLRRIEGIVRAAYDSLVDSQKK